MSALLVNATVVKQLFLQCSSLERASRSLAKTGLFVALFFIFFFVFFFCSFLGGSWRGLLASVGSFGCHLVPILESFSSLFRDWVDP